MPDSPSTTIEIIARGVSFRDGRVLLCRNVEHGHCYLPGGHVEPGEAAAHACEREYLEETGLSVRAGECCMVAEVRFVQEGGARHEINLVFHVEQSQGGLMPEQVSSREPELQFVWMPMNQLEISDFRPRALLGPLRSLGAQPSSEQTVKPMWICDQE